MPDRRNHQLLIGAPSSNAGKTTVTLGLLRAFQKRGLGVQPFKCGPDYIDPKFHEMACGTPSLNLDMMMMSPQHLKDTYHHYAAQADLRVTEGVMGLFDGAVKSQGSSAALAKTLGLPVVLVVDAKAVAYSVAPLLYGFKNFDPTLELAGVIFNRVNTASHFRFLEEACQEVGVRTFGHVPYVGDIEIPSRHLGLSLDGIQSYSPAVDRIAAQLEQTVRLDDLLEAVQRPMYESKPKAAAKNKKKWRVAIARDEAFSFLYPQNIRKIEEHGEVVFFSPLSDTGLPEVDWVYLPGGYPELFAGRLSANVALRRNLSDFIFGGGSVLAECGGLMYLGKSLMDASGQYFDMVGALGIATSMQGGRLSLGYRKVCWEGCELVGHEFHYSSLDEKEAEPTLGKVTDIRDREVPTKMYQKNNVLASYVHLYFGEEGQFESIMKLLKLPL